MNPMLAKLATLWPEIILLIGAGLCLLLGLSAQRRFRRATPWVAGAALVAAGLTALPDLFDQEFMTTGNLGLSLATYVKLAVAGVGLVLLLVAAQLPDQLRTNREVEAEGRPFDPALLLRGEFFAFFLLSLVGVMLTAGAGDLVWLFLALELTSLPTYVMVATMRDHRASQEAAVKYFFLGAMAAAVFLYGFTLIYGVTGYTRLWEIRQFIVTHYAADQLPPLLLAGVVLAIAGLTYKIAAVPMHFYAADVYQGAASPVTAFLAFVPKTAGFVAIILMLGLLGWPERALPGLVSGLLVAVAVLTMTVGNVLGLWQSSVKRVLAYSSIAHSGYMLVGLLGAGVAITVGEARYASMTQPAPASALGNGVGAVLFYLVAYGLATIGAFAVLASLQARGEEADTFDDISGLWRRHPLLAGVMLLSVLSLIGIPPLVGFLGKVYLFGAAIQQGYLVLVVIAVLNSAVSAVYYLRIAGACFFGAPADPGAAAQTIAIAGPARRTGAVAAAVAALLLGFAGGWLVDLANAAKLPLNPPPSPPPRVAQVAPPTNVTR